MVSLLCFELADCGLKLQPGRVAMLVSPQNGLAAPSLLQRATVWRTKFILVSATNEVRWGGGAVGPKKLVF